jgi:hypothetical protein
MRSAFAVLSVIFSIGFLAAQTPVSGPTESFIFDLPTNSLRSIVGFLGSASLGPAILPKLDYASVAPQKNYAIAFQDGRCLVVSGLDSEHVTTTTLPGAFSVPESVAWSGDGSVAVLYSRTGNWVRTISDLPISPNAASILDLTSLDLTSQGGALSTVVADLHGEHVVIGITGDNAGVFQIASDQSFVPLISVSKPISLAFSDDGRKLYILNGDSMQLSELNLTDSTSQTWRINELEDPIAVRLARDAAQRQVIYVAGRKDQSLFVYDSGTHEVVGRVSLTFQPSGIEILGRDSYLLRPRVSYDDPLWSFRNSAQPMVYFVPATPLIAREDSSR